MEDIWKNCLSEIREKLHNKNIDKWFKNTNLESISDNHITISVPNSYSGKTISQTYKKELEEFFKKKFEKKNITFSFINTPPKKKSEENEGRSATVSKKNPSPSQDFSLTGLNKDKTFKNFIKCSSNEYAFAAAEAVSQNTGGSYNPLFIYGGVGLGKTHLLFAIGNKAYKKGLTVHYVTIEDFVNDMISHIRKKKMEVFQKKYRNADILMIDDIHFIKDKEKTQIEFFHTFNYLYNQNKQIVIASDQLPKEIKLLEERLRSRLSSGLIVDIQPPDFETRIAITMEKAKERKVHLNNDVLEWIAQRITTNIRDIEGAVTRLGFHSQLANQEITLEFAKKTLYELLGQESEKLSLQLIIKKTAEHFHIKPADIKSTKRTRDISFPRQVAMYLCRELLPITTIEMGNGFGGKDHSSIVVSHKKIKKLLETDMVIQQDIKDIKKKLPL